MFREHPVKILYRSFRFLWVLALPVVHSLRTVHSLPALTTGELFFPAAMLCFGWLSWYRRSVTADKDGLIIHDGIIIRRVLFIPAGSLAALTAARPLWLRPFHAAAVYAEASSGFPEKAELSLLLRHKDLIRIRRLMPMNARLRHSCRCKTGILRMIAFSGLFSSVFSGAVYAAAFLLQFGRVLTEIMHEFGLNRPPWTAGTPTGQLLAGAAVLWGLSFLCNILRYTDFTLETGGTLPEVRCGLLTKRVTLLQKILFPDIRQNLLMRLLRIGSLRVSCPGCGPKRSGIAVCLPLLPERELLRRIPRFFPEKKLLPQGLRPEPSALWTALLLPVLAAGTAAAAGIALHIPVFLLLLPLLWQCLIRAVAHRTNGICLCGSSLCIRYRRGTVFHTVLTDTAHVAKAGIMRFFWQKKLCRVTLHLAGDSPVRCTVSCLDRTQAESLLQKITAGYAPYAM